MPDRMRRYARAVQRQHRGQGAAFLKGSGQGWVTAEYGMLPRATNTRNRREAAAGKQSGRTQEIQRLIGRALRAGIDRRVGRTPDRHRLRRHSGRWRHALRLDHRRLGGAASGGEQASEGGHHLDRPDHGQCRRRVLRHLCRSAGPDLDYAEDSEAGTDGNFIMTGTGRLIEVQMSAEGATFSRAEMTQLLDLAEGGIAELVRAQNEALV